VQKAEDKGVEFRTGQFIDGLSLDKNAVTSVNLSSGECIDCSFVVWTIAPILALRAAGLSYKSSPPALRTTTLFHFSFDRKLLIDDALYVWIWDVNFRSFRITLYPNLNEGKHKAVYSVTSEVLSNNEESQCINSETIVQELKDLGVVAKDAKLISQSKKILDNTFPIPEVGTSQRSEAVNRYVNESMHNLHILGRSTGKAWFMTDLLKLTYQELSGA
jgi:hypothetical protein